MIGLLALIFWAFGAVFTLFIKSIPIFELLTLIFSVSFLLNLGIIACKREKLNLSQPWFLWVVGVMGIYGNDLLYIEAFKNAPAAHADLINYLWPILVVLFASLLPNEKFNLRYLLATIIGFFAVAFLLITDCQVPFSVAYLKGYFYAFMDACVWATYTLLARKYQLKSPEVVGFYCGIGALISLFLHNMNESFVMPSHFQWGMIALMGATTQGLAYYFWEFGIKRGNFKLLSIAAYLNPIASVCLLILFGMTSFSYSLLVSTLLISLAALLTLKPGLPRRNKALLTPKTLDIG